MSWKRGFKKGIPLERTPPWITKGSLRWKTMGTTGLLCSFGCRSCFLKPVELGWLYLCLCLFLILFQSYASETVKSKSYLNHSPSAAMLSGEQQSHCDSLENLFLCLCSCSFCCCMLLWRDFQALYDLKECQATKKTFTSPYQKSRNVIFALSMLLYPTKCIIKSFNAEGNHLWVRARA